MPIRRGMGGLSSGAGGNLFDRPGFFDYSEIVNLTVDTQLLLKAATETYGIKITHADTSGASQDYELEIPALTANAEIVTTNHPQTLTNKTISDLRLPALYDSNGNELFLFTSTSSAVNEITLANAATGNPPVLSATGGDTNIGITLTPKGSGVVRITGGLTVDGTTTTLNSTTLTIDDKNIELGSVASPSDTTADGGGITLKGATDKTIIWDNANDNWTSNQDWNIASGKSFKINNAVTLNATTLGSAVVTSSLTTIGTLNSGAISSGFGNVDIGTSVLTAGQLNIDNIRIDGNTISSTSGQIFFDATTTLDFGDDSALNIGTLTLDAIHGDANAIQIGDNSDDAVSIYRVNALTAIGDLDIGAHDFRASTITADSLTAGQVIYTGTNGLLSAEAGFEYNASSNLLTINTISSSTINAFTLGGKLTAGSTEIEGSNFDINGGTVDGITSLTIANNVDVGNYTVRANNFLADSHTAGRVFFAGTDGVLTTDSDLTFATDTLTVTKIGAFEAVGSINFSDEAMTNVNIDSGAIDATTLGGSSAVTLSAASVGAGLTWGAAQNFGSNALTNVNIDSGTINNITSFGIKQAATVYEMQIATGATTLTANRVVTIDPKDATRTISLSGNLTLNHHLTTGSHNTTFSTTDTTLVTFPTSGTLATLAGNETLTNKVLTTPTISSTGFANANHAHAASNSGGQIATSALSGDIALGSQTSGNYVATITGGTGITSSAATSGEGTTHTLSIDASQGQITTVGALNAGSITSGFTSIDVGAGAISTTGLISGGSLDIDDVVVNGSTIGHTDDTDLITLADGNVTIAGELDLTTLDVSGNADIDGTLEADAITVAGTALNEYIADTIGAMVTSNTESGIAVAYQDGDNTLDFTVGTLNQDTTGTAAIATTVTITDNESTNENNAIIFTAGGDLDGGNIGLESDGTFHYNPSTGTVTATAFDGAMSGNSTTATLASTVTVVDSTDTSSFIAMFDSATGSLAAKTDAGITYNSGTGTLTATAFVGPITGNVTGNASGTAATVTGGTQASITSAANLVTVGALNAGSITSGFTSIDVGSGAISSTGTITTGALVVGGDVSTAAAQDWDLVDNNASALSFDAAGKTGILEIDTRNSAERVTMSGDLLVSGDLTVSGTTTTVNSTTVTITDPIFNLGGTSAPGSDDNKDRGISFQWHNGSAAKVGFFGYDDSVGKFIFVPDATINSEVVSGTAGTLVATTFEGALSGNASTATALATARTIGGTSFDGTGNIAVALSTLATTVTVTDNESTNEENAIVFTAGGDVDGGNLGLESDGNLTYNPSSGTLTATTFVGAVTGTITEATSVTVVANNSTDETVYPTFVDGATGTQGIETDTGLTYNPSSGILTTTQLTGNVVGNVTGNTSGTAATVTTAAQTTITSLGTLTALTVDDVTIDGKVVTMTGSSSDTAVFTAGTNGTLSIVTTDDAAAAANIQITADGTVDIDSAGILTLDSGAAINIEPAAGSAILLDGTISVDAGVVTGATSITSTAFVGDITGDLTGDVTGSSGSTTGNAATATEATNITAVANNSTNETVYPTFVDGATGTQGIETDTGLTYNPSTGVITATQFTGAVSGNATTATALAAGVTIGMTGDVVWTSPSFTGSGNVTAAATIQANAVQSAMLHQDVIGDRTTLGSGDVATTADYLLIWDATGSVLKKVTPDNLGVSGQADGETYQIQYNDGSDNFLGADNVTVQSATLALKEMSAPTQVSGFGLIYTGTNNELYYKDESGNDVKITNGGSLAGGGAFRGIKAYLTANNTISTGSSTTPTTWTESYDVGGFHVASGGTENRFTFGQVGYYEIKVQQEWAADAVGYREMSVVYRDVSGSSNNTILRDRMDGSSSANISGASTTVYVDDAADYVTVNLYQNSGADLVATGNNDDATAITITRVDVATQGTNASGASGRVQFSDGSGGFNSDGDLTFVTDTLTATKIGAFEAAGAINFANQNMTNVDIDSGDMTGVTISGALTWSAAQDLNNVNLTNIDIDTGDIASAVTINKSPVITLGGDLTGNATLSTLGNATLTATIAGTSVEGSMLNNNVISGQTELASGLAAADELFISDGGTLKRMDVSVLSAYQAALSETLTNKTLTTPTIGDLTNATHAHTNNASGGTIAITNLTGTLAVASGGTGATTLNDLITLGTHTTGNYVATITGGTGITSSAATSGEGTTHSLSVDAAQGHITSVGTLTSLTTSGDITTTAAVDWDLLDNSASALSFDAAGKSGILEIVTTNGSEKVVMSGDLTVAGNMTVTGTTTQVNTVTMNAQNAIIFEGATADNNETTLTIVDPTADHTVYMPNQSGYLPVLAAASTTQISATPAELNIMDGVTATAAELNLIDGSSANTVVNSKAVIYGSSGELAGTLSTVAQTTITSLGTLTALQVDNLNINTNTISSTAGTDLLITPLAGQQLVLDGTIIIDAGVVTGASSITSTAFVGDITGDVTGTADVATVATTVTITDNESTNEDNAIIFTAGGDVDGGNLGLESDGNLIYNPSTGRITATQVAGTVVTATQNSITTMTGLTTTGTIGTGVWQGTAIASGYIADDAITLAKMASGTDGNVISYDASGNPVAIATGTDGQVLTSTGAGSPPAFEDASSGGGNTFELVADGAITAGQALAVTTAGKAKDITGSGMVGWAYATGSNDYIGANGSVAVAYDHEKNYGVWFWADDEGTSTNYYGKMQAFTIGSDGEPDKVGDEQRFHTAQTSEIHAHYDPDSNGFIVAWRNPGNHKAFATHITVGDGNNSTTAGHLTIADLAEDANMPEPPSTAAFQMIDGEGTTFGDGGPSHRTTASVHKSVATGGAYSIPTGVFLFFADGLDSAEGKAYFVGYDATGSGNLSGSGSAVWNTNAVEDLAAAYDPDTDRLIVAYDDGRGISYVIGYQHSQSKLFIAASHAGDSASAIIDASTDGQRSLAATYDTTNNKVIISSTSPTSPYPMSLWAGTVSSAATSGMTVSWGTKFALMNHAANVWGVQEVNIVHHPGTNQTCVFHHAIFGAPYIHFSWVSLSGTTISLVKTINSNADGGLAASFGNKRDLQVIHETDNDLFHLILRAEGASNRVSMGPMNPNFRADVTSAAYIGIATATVADGATATVQFMGVNENLSSLTIGSKYYLSGTGDILTNWSTTQVGIAIAATKLLIGKDTP